MTSDKPLDIGIKYEVVGLFKASSIQDKSIKNYRLSLGIVGSGAITNIKTKYTSCDLLCRSIKSTNQF